MYAILVGKHSKHHLTFNLQTKNQLLIHWSLKLSWSFFFIFFFTFRLVSFDQCTPFMRRLFNFITITTHEYIIWFTFKRTLLHLILETSYFWQWFGDFTHLILRCFGVFRPKNGCVWSVFLRRSLSS